MTCALHHGAPGSYKTFSITQNVLIDALDKGRVVITNIRGFNKLDVIEKVLEKKFPSSAAIWYLEPNDEGFHAMATFFHWAPAGALIAMDEGQRIYPTRSRRFDQFDLNEDLILVDQFDQPLIDVETQKPILRPKTVEIAFDQHRHYNWDIYISTPNISKIHKEIRHVVEWAYRHRNNSGLLPWLKNTWTEFRHDPENNGKSLSHYSGSPKRYKSNPKIFACYQSTATGIAKDSNENISIFRDSRLRFLFIVIFLSVSYLVWQLLSAFDRVKGNVDAPSQKVNVPGVETNQAPVVVPSGAIPSLVFNQVSTPVSNPRNPLADAHFYWVGSINGNLLFEVEFPAKLQLSNISLSYSDLRQLGYTLAVKGGSFIALSFEGSLTYAFEKPIMRADEHGLATGERNQAQEAINLAQSSFLTPSVSASETKN